MAAWQSANDNNQNQHGMPLSSGCEGRLMLITRYYYCGDYLLIYNNCCGSETKQVSNLIVFVPQNVPVGKATYHIDRLDLRYQPVSRHVPTLLR